MSDRTFEIRVPAKVNLGLRVLGRREDGYHRIRTLLVGVEMWDTLRFESGGDRVRLTCSDPAIPEGGENLVLKAAGLLAEAAGKAPPPVHIHLDKRIPPGRGLGGGSADAAGALFALDRLWGIGLCRAKLVGIAARIGMDVPYFLEGGLALGVGRGEALYPLSSEPGLILVLALPDFGISTPDAYRGLSGRAATISGAIVSADIVEISGVGRVSLENDLEHSEAWSRSPNPHAVPRIRSLLRQAGAFASAMSGSGSAVFGVFTGWDEAVRGAGRLRQEGIEARPVRTVSREAQRAALFGNFEE